MKHKDRPWRKVMSSTRRLEEHVSLNRRIFTWRAIPVTTLVLDCGHEKIVRGDSVPRLKTVCKTCEQACG